MLEQAIPYLLQRGLLTPESIVDGSVVVTDVSGRNPGFKVESENGPSYLLKQATGPDSQATGGIEAGVYQWLWKPANRALHSYLPSLYGYDTSRQALVLELILGATDFAEYHRQMARFPAWPAVSLGRALAALHDLPAAAENPDLPVSSVDQAELALSLHRPAPDILRYASWGNLEVIKLVQRYQEVGDHLDELRAGWRNEALIHFDLKWDNCLLSRNPGDGARRLSLIDWEFAGLGDPRWDVGSVLGGYLTFWVNSIPLFGETDPERLAALARYPLARMHRALAAFWQAYVRARGIEDAGDAWLMVCVQYSAVWLLQTALSQTATSAEAGGHASLLVQLALNILRRPEQAVALLGFVPAR